MELSEIQEVRSRLAAGSPYRARISTMAGSGWLYLVPFTEDRQGLLLSVEGEGSYFLDSKTVPTVWDLVGAGVAIPTAEPLYQFLATLLAPPRRERRRWVRLGNNKWVQRDLLTKEQKANG